MVMATSNRKPNNVARFRFRFCRYRAIAGQQQTPFVENKFFTDKKRKAKQVGGRVY